MKLRNSPFFYFKMSHLFSYLAISILPVLICIGMLSVHNIGEQRARLDESVLYGLRQFNYNYLTVMESMDACSGHLDDRIEEGISGGEISAQLLSYEKNYPQFSSVFYFEKTSSRIFTSSGEMGYRDFERMVKNDYHINLTSMAFYTNLCQSMGDDTMVSGGEASNIEDGAQYLFYLKLLPRLDPEPKRVLVFMMPIHAVIGRLDEYVPEGYSVYSYSDRYLTWLVQQGGECSSEQLQTELNTLRSDNPCHTRIGGEGYLLLRVKSTVDGMYHMIGYRDDVLYQPIRDAAARVLAPVLGTILLAAAAAFFMHRYYYRGIEQLLRLPFPVENAVEPVNCKRPLAYIAANTTSVLDQNRKMALDIRQYNVRQMLNGLLHGSIDESTRSSDSPAGAALQSIMRYPRFTVAYLRALSEPCQSEYISLEMANEGITFWMLPLRDGAAAILINHEPCEIEALRDRLEQFLAQQNVQFWSGGGIGLIQESADSIPVSLLQAQAASLDQSGRVRIYDASDVKLEDLMPISEKNRVCKGILAGDSALALTAFQQLNEKLQNVTLDHCLSREWYLFMLEAILCTLQENLYPSIVAAWNVDDLIRLYGANDDETFRRFIVQVCDEVRAQEAKRTEAMQNQVAGYIAEHILEEDLSLQKLSDVFGIPESAVTAILKQSTDMSFAKYVTHCKMEYVCKELRETNRTIKDIIAGVGYMDVSNFTRKFRLQFGCTPSAYRENSRKGQLRDVNP